MQLQVCILMDWMETRSLLFMVEYIDNNSTDNMYSNNKT